MMGHNKKAEAALIDFSPKKPLLWEVGNLSQDGLKYAALYLLMSYDFIETL